MTPPNVLARAKRYYYAEKGTDGRGGGFLNGALEDGFLKVNQSDVKFSLMWANQDWVDVCGFTSACQQRRVVNSAHPIA